MPTRLLQDSVLYDYLGNRSKLSATTKPNDTPLYHRLLVLSLCHGLGATWTQSQALTYVSHSRAIKCG